MAKLHGNAIVGQSGGPTAVINQSLVGVVEAAAQMPEIEALLGARHGVKGILGESFFDLLKEPKDVLEAVAGTPSSALGSVRKKPSKEECLQMFEVMRRNNVRYYFYIGGNDSAETAYIVHQTAQAAGYELRCFHVPKTIDNDLRVTDHCPGYGSAARFVASALMGDDLDNRSLPGVKIDIVMGRHAGFLTAAAALGRKDPDDGPHLVYLPERPVTRERIRDDIASVYQRLGRCVVAVSEGIVDAADARGRTFTEVMLDGTDVERDTHGNVQLSGTGALGDWLVAYLKKELGAKLRLRADTFGYLQRSFPGVVSDVDAAEARECGRRAVRYAVADQVDGSSVVMLRQPGEYRIEYSHTPLANVAKETRHLPDEYITPEGTHVTPAFLDYASPLVGPLPTTGRFLGMRG